MNIMSDTTDNDSVKLLLSPSAPQAAALKNETFSRPSGGGWASDRTNTADLLPPRDKGGLSAKQIAEGVFKKGYYRIDLASDSFTDVERGWAERLLQGGNLERLNNASRTGRRYRPVPVVTWFEYWWWRSANSTSSSWRMERVENGRRTDHHWNGEIVAEIARLKADGFTVREIRIDGAPSLIKPSAGPCVRRKTFAERYGSLGSVRT